MFFIFGYQRQLGLVQELLAESLPVLLQVR
jgi:hypothetical protein